MAKRRHAWPGLLVLCITAAIAFIALQRTPFWQHLETQALDQRFQWRGPRPAPDGIVILTIDDRSLRDLGGWPLRRDLLSAAIDRLNIAGAGTIGIDLLLLPQPGPSASAQDERIAASLGRADHAVLAVALPRLDISTELPTRDVEGGGQLLQPPPVLTAAAALGHVNVLLDGDGRLRRLLPTVIHDGERLPALPLAMYRGMAAQTDRPVPEHSAPVWLDFYGAETSFHTVSLADLLQDRVDNERLRGRAILIGATATGLGDAYATPFTPRLPGVAYFATALGNLMDGRMIRRDEGTVAIDAAIVALAALLAALVAQRLTPGTAGLATLAVAVAILAAQQHAFAEYGLWLSTFGPPLAMLTALTASFGTRLLAERRRRDRSEARVSNLRRYVAPALADTLADEATPQFADRIQNATVLFIDIARFTGISEAIGPRPTATLLRNFHATIEDVVNAHGGVLTSFLGDGAMAVFGLPTTGDDDASRALAAARELAQAFSRWSPLRIGIGLHSGPVVVAQIGGREQVQVTATGDTVNLASRLENLSRTHDAAITLSDAVYDAVRAHGDTELLRDLVAIGSAQIRGRRAPVQAWILPGLDKPTTDAREGGLRIVRGSAHAASDADMAGGGSLS